jgi:hypothetical protein
MRYVPIRGFHPSKSGSFNRTQNCHPIDDLPQRVRLSKSEREFRRTSCDLWWVSLDLLIKRRLAVPFGRKFNINDRGPVKLRNSKTEWAWSTYWNHMHPLGNLLIEIHFHLGMSSKHGKIWEKFESHNVARRKHVLSDIIGSSSPFRPCAGAI